MTSPAKHTTIQSLLRQIGDCIPFTGLHWLVVSISLLATLIAWQLSLNSRAERISAKFTSQVDYAITLFEQQMYRYADMLNAGAGFVAGSEEVLPEEWRRFTERMALEEMFPAIGGMGVVLRVELEELDEFLERQRVLRPEFSIRPPVDPDSVSRDHFVMPLTLIAPQRLENTAPGLDLAREARRRDAIERTIKTGTVQITAPITPENTQSPGFAMIAPVFRTSMPETEALRESEFIGATVAAVITANLAEGLLASGMRQVALKVSDNTDIMYNELIPENEDIDPQPMMTISRTIPLFGRDWQFDFYSTKTFRRENTNSVPSLILFSGLTIDTLLMLLFLRTSRANQRAVQLGRTIALKSEELRKSNDALEERNGELEAFSYLVSHDLKAPLRAIEFLADCIDEDIVQKQSKAAVPPELANYVERVQKQVTLAQRLVTGVLQYSGLHTDREIAEEVSVKELLRSFPDLLGIEPAQLHTRGEFPTFRTYGTQLTQVFMNLVSNAFKYHHGKGIATVTIRTVASPLEGYYRFTVTDNGPGIAHEQQKQIFEPFYTLQPKDHSMSSGVGLAIVKKLVSLHGGAVVVSSDVGMGTCFSFDWPQTISEQNDRDECSPLPDAA